VDLEADMRKIDFENFSAARVQNLRSTNRAIVLNFIRYHQPISRAAIAERSGLQRSTVSLIVDELIGHGTLSERRAPELKRGGVPRLLSINAKNDHAIGVDIEVSQTTVALSDLMGSITEREVLPTPAEPAELINVLSRAISRMTAATPRSSAVNVGIAIPGLVDHHAGIVLSAADLGWSNFPLGPRLQRRLNTPVFVDNESNLSALAEIWHGDFSKHSCPDLVFVNVKEGIGTGLVIGGQVYRGFAGLASEFGHMIIQAGGPKCGCGNDGCWETLADNRATIHRYLAEQPRREPNGRRRGSNRITMKEIVNLALSGQKHARAALTQTVKYLAMGIQNIVVGLSPEFVVIAGEITRAWPLICHQLETQLKSGILGLTFEQTRVIPTSLREKPSLAGALSLGIAASFGLPSQK
jgi:predicted NBD/HSP70 family sugar kinase